MAQPITKVLLCTSDGKDWAAAAVSSSVVVVNLSVDKEPPIQIQSHQVCLFCFGGFVCFVWGVCLFVCLFV